jgi:protein-tyrosine phosphatase
VRSWRDSGLDEVVSLLTPDEVTEFALNQEEKWCGAYGIHFRAFSIPDRGVPGSVDGFTRLVQEIERALNAGKKIGLHCRQSIGRSALVAAVLLVSAGKTPETAWKTISQARGLPVPDTIEQREWVKGFTQAHQT